MEENDVLITKYGRAKINNKGYWVITSVKEGNHMKLLHRLIYEEEYGVIPQGYHVHHKNKVKTDNRIENLELIEHGLHTSLHHKGKEVSDETRKKQSEASKKQWEDDEYRKMMSEKFSENHYDCSGINNPRAKYDFWNILCVHYLKTTMFRDNPKLNPRKCFRYKFKGHHVPIGGFHDFVSIEIINELVKEVIGE